MNMDIKNHIKHCPTLFDFQQMQLRHNIIHHEIPAKGAGAEMFTLHNIHYLCNVDYRSNFPAIKKMEDLEQTA